MRTIVEQKPDTCTSPPYIPNKLWKDSYSCNLFGAPISKNKTALENVSEVFFPAISDSLGPRDIMARPNSEALEGLMRSS